MPELYARAIKKWPNNFSGLTPTLDFSNGVRVRDIAIDTGQSPNWIWVCVDNTIGSPIWRREEHSFAGSVPDNAITAFEIANASVDTMIIIAYTMTNGGFHHDGLVRISHDGANACAEHEFGGRVPVYDLEVDADISSGKLRILFDTTAGVGTALSVVYNIMNRI